MKNTILLLLIFACTFYCGSALQCVMCASYLECSRATSDSKSCDGDYCYSIRSHRKVNVFTANYEERGCLKLGTDSSSYFHTTDLNAVMNSCRLVAELTQTECLCNTTMCNRNLSALVEAIPPSIECRQTEVGRGLVKMSSCRGRWCFVTYTLNADMTKGDAIKTGCRDDGPGSVDRNVSICLMPGVTDAKLFSHSLVSSNSIDCLCATSRCTDNLRVFDDVTKVPIGKYTRKINKEDISVSVEAMVYSNNNATGHSGSFTITTGSMTLYSAYDSYRPNEVENDNVAILTTDTLMILIVLVIVFILVVLGLLWRAGVHKKLFPKKYNTVADED